MKKETEKVLVQTKLWYIPKRCRKARTKIFSGKGLDYSEAIQNLRHELREFLKGCRAYECYRCVSVNRYTEVDCGYYTVERGDFNPTQYYEDII